MKARLKALRQALGMTQKEFGDRLGVAGKHVGKWETGEAGLSDSRVYQICHEFKVRREWLENGAGEMFEPPTDEEKLAREIQRKFCARVFESLPKDIQDVIMQLMQEYTPKD